MKVTPIARMDPMMHCIPRGILQDRSDLMNEAKYPIHCDDVTDYRELGVSSRDSDTDHRAGVSDNVSGEFDASQLSTILSGGDFRLVDGNDHPVIASSAPSLRCHRNDEARTYERNPTPKPEMILPNTIERNPTVKV